MVEDIEIEEPIDGAIFHSLQGKKIESGLLIGVSGHVLTNEPVYVNGVEAKRK